MATSGNNRENRDEKETSEESTKSLEEGNYENARKKRRLTTAEEIKNITSCSRYTTDDKSIAEMLLEMSDRIAKEEAESMREDRERDQVDANDVPLETALLQDVRGPESDEDFRLKGDNEIDEKDV
ncbi:hypothetical protein CDAR_243031 [Caerostris darwini]|uniref:Uncharacterized protein n=1 Tax=Caerostris darwini TaxID=1538125 RepID=A0AAV4STM4_9ARAC|nr:hypothetical protein CDAR_243031 [Caerostris darwini]